MSIILLDAAYGPNNGYGHVKRLSILGEEFERQGALVAWKGSDAEAEVKALTSFAPFPAAAIGSTAIDAIVTDGTPYDPAEESILSRYAIGGSLDDIPAPRWPGLRGAYLQTVRKREVLNKRMRYGADWIIVDPALVDDRPWEIGDAEARPILVTFGGSTLGRELTIELATTLHAAQWVIWPDAYGEPPQLPPNVVLVRDPRNAEMRHAYRHCRMVIGAFGMTTWEALAAGLPGLYVSWSRDHTAGYEPLVGGYAIGYLGMAESGVSVIHAAYRAGVITGLLRLAPDGINADLMDRRKRLEFDGLGARRIAAEIMNDIREAAS